MQQGTGCRVRSEDEKGRRGSEGLREGRDNKEG